MTATLKLGVFGGTFNPIHLGHLRAAEEAREALGLDQVLFVPAKLPPHKEGGDVAPSHARLEWVRRATRGNAAFRVSELELDREGPSYSIHTLRRLREDRGEETQLWFLVGVDAFREIHTWYRYAELFTLANFGVLRRPPNHSFPAPPADIEDQFEAKEWGYLHRSGHEVRWLDVTLIDISSTRIRRALATGRSVRYLVPEAALDALQGWRET